jgi:aminocarboxymuconate-semialdehyde decarboxylase
MLGSPRLMVGTDHPAMNREPPVGRTLRMVGLSPAELDDITWNNCFGWLESAAPVLKAPGP